jgi:purine-nucleoside phosphorylase
MGRFLETGAGGLPAKAIFTDDPLRAKMLVAHHLDHATLVSEQRGMVAYSGDYDGVSTAVISTGFGESALLQWLHEAAACGVKEALYLGECISQSDLFRLRDVVLASAAEGRNVDTPDLADDPGCRALANQSLLTRATNASIRLGVDVVTETVFTDDRFWLYHEETQFRIIDFVSNAFYRYAHHIGVSPLSILTVSERYPTGERMEEADRQSRFHEAALLAFKT